MTQKGLSPILIILILAALVSGYLVYQKQTPSTGSTGSPQASSGQATQPSPTSDPTVYTESDRSTNWKTYTSKGGEYTFSYPNIWNYETGQANMEFAIDVVKFYPPEIKPTSGPFPYMNQSPVLIIGLYTTPFNQSPTSNKTQNGTNLITDWKKVIIDGIEGHSYKNVSTHILNVDFPFKNGQQTISVTYYDDRYTPEINQILSTFKFLD